MLLEFRKFIKICSNFTNDPIHVPHTSSSKSLTDDISCSEYFIIRRGKFELCWWRVRERASVSFKTLRHSAVWKFNYDCSLYFTLSPYIDLKCLVSLLFSTDSLHANAFRRKPLNVIACLRLHWREVLGRRRCKLIKIFGIIKFNVCQTFVFNQSSNCFLPLSRQADADTVQDQTPKEV